ncbi:MAG: SMC-Scp complex subunit ScpB [Planctomycetales bacterium]|nr:SMC-Scp complex subunit ScpB [Planctomycetales bacterium]
MADSTTSPTAAPLSLKRLTAAFAQMLGGSREQPPQATGPKQDPCEIGPRSIVEAILFVGAEDGRARTREELAAVMRDVTAEEVDQAVDELNSLYERDGAAYEILRSASGYRLTLRDSLLRVRDRFYGKVKQARLSPAALEVLSLVAYRQPMTGAAIDNLRGARSGPLLSQLVRRGLLRQERADSGDQAARYLTTPRFLQAFRLSSLDQLPRAAELDDC